MSSYIRTEELAVDDSERMVRLLLAHIVLGKQPTATVRINMRDMLDLFLVGHEIEWEVDYDGTFGELRVRKMPQTVEGEVVCSPEQNTVSEYSPTDITIRNDAGTCSEP